MPEWFSPNFWWILALVLLVLEIITPATVLIFISLAAVSVALLSYIFPFKWFLAGIFFLLSFLFIKLVRPIVLQNTERSKFGVDALAGSEVMVVEEINHKLNTGKVKYNGIVFLAESLNNEIIPVNIWVSVDSVDGIKLKVKREN
ncbi:MAG: NfeD family protein [Brevinemataceae bacterium]